MFDAYLCLCNAFVSHNTFVFDESRFDLQGVLEYGGQLLSSGGQEYDVGVDKMKSPSERLARQKQNLHRRLGEALCILCLFPSSIGFVTQLYSRTAKSKMGLSCTGILFSN